MTPIEILMKVLGTPQAAAELEKITGKLKEQEIATERVTQSEEERYQAWLQQAAVRQETEKREVAAMTAAQEQKWQAVRRVNAATVQSGQQAAKAVGLARHEMVNLAYQVQDAGVMMAMGANPLTILVTQGTQAASILLTTQATVSGFFKQLAAGAAAAAKPVGVLAAALGTLVIAWQGVKTALAEADAADALADLGQSNRRMGDSLLKQLDEFVANGHIKVERAKEISADIRNAFGDEGLAFGAKMPVGPGGLNASNPGMVADLMVAFARELRAKLPEQLTKAGLEAHRAAGMARLEAEREVQRAMSQLQLQKLEESYRAGTLSIEGYLARRRQIAVEENEREKKLITAQEQDLRVKIMAADGDDKAKLSVSAAQFGERRKRAAIELEAELSEISAMGIEDRQKKIEEAMQRYAAKSAAVMQAARQQFQTRTTEIGSDFTLTEPQRYDALRRAAEAAAAAGTITREELVQFKAQLGPDPSSWVDQWSSGITRLADSWGTLQQTVVGSTLGLINSGVDALAGGIARAVVVTGDLKQAWADVKIMVLQALAQEVIGYGIRKGLALGWKALTSSLRAADTAETVTAESTKAAAAAPAATMMSISSWGLAAIIGGAAILGALASVAFREQGGPVEAGKPYIVGERRPELFIPRTSGVILPSVPSPSLPNLSAGGGSAMGGGGAASTGGGNMQVAFYGSAREAMEGVILSGAADAYLANIIDGRVRRVVPGT